MEERSEEKSDNNLGIEPEIEPEPPKKSMWKKFFLIFKIFRLPFDLIRFSLDYARIILWVVFRLVGLNTINMFRLMGLDTMISCPFADSFDGIKGDDFRCVHARRYGILTIFHSICPKALRDKKSPEIIMCEQPDTWLEIGFPRLIGLGMVLTLIWGSIAFGIIMATPARRIFLRPEKQAVLQTPKKDNKSEHAPKFYEHAQELYQAGEFAKARIEYLNAVQRDPENPEYHAGLGNVSLKLGDIGTAEGSLKKAVELDPKTAKAHTGLGYIALIKRDIESACKHGTTAKSLGDTGKDLYFLLAECHLSHSESREAEAMIQKGLNSDADNEKTLFQAARFYSRTRSFKKAVDTYDHLLKKFPDNITASIELAVIYRQQQKFDMAKKRLDAVLEKDFLNVPARAELAEILFARGQRQESIEAYRQLVVEKPNTPRIAARLAELYVFSGQADKGLNAAKKALTIYPDNPEANLVAARIYYGRNLYSDTIRYCRQGLKNRRKLPGLYRLLASALIKNESFTDAGEKLEEGLRIVPGDPVLLRMKCLILWREGNPQDALSCAGDLAKKNPKSAISDIFMASIRLEQKSYKKAIAHYEDAIKKAPENSTIINNLANLLVNHTNKLARAEKLARKVKSIMPGDPIAADTLGWVYYHKKNYKNAISELYFAAQKMGQNPTIRYHLGAAYHKTGRMKESEAELKAALALSADFDEAGKARDLLARIKNRE